MNGKLRTINAERGFGFINGEDGRAYFFHKSGVDGNFHELHEDDSVTFEEEASTKGPRAANVRLIQAATAA